jgi:hypothetical protein
MTVERNFVARSHNECCSGKATTHSVFVVELHGTVKYLKILSAVQQRCYKNKTHAGLLAKWHMLH